MRTIGVAGLGGAQITFVALVALLLAGVRPSGAQVSAGEAMGGTDRAVGGQMPMTLVIAVFPSDVRAEQAMNGIKAASRQRLDSYAVVTRDSRGKVKVQKRGTKNSTSSGASANTIDGAIAFLEHRAPDVTNSSPVNTGISAADTQTIQGMVYPDNTAILLVVPQADLRDVDSAMRQATRVLDARLAPR